MSKSLRIGLLFLQIFIASCSFKKAEVKNTSAHEEVIIQKTITSAKILSNDEKELLDLVRFGSSDTLNRFLEAHSMDLNFSDADGNQPIGLAKSRGIRAIFDLLIKYGASIYMFEERNPENLSDLVNDSHWFGPSPNDPDYKQESDDRKQAIAADGKTNSLPATTVEPESDASYIKNYFYNDFRQKELVIKEALSKKDFLTIHRMHTAVGISCDLISFTLIRSLQLLPKADLADGISIFEKYLNTSGCSTSPRYSLAVELYRAEWMRQLKTDQDDPSLLYLITRLFPSNPREIQVHPFYKKMVLIKIHPRFLFLMYGKKLTPNLDNFASQLRLPEGFNYSEYSPDGYRDVSDELAETDATSGKECLISFLDGHPLHHCDGESFYDENSDYHQLHPENQ